uniref:Uncharacterized protein n=1 Tax=Clytia hemisphaerica TaxID=252671 RepID=A0A7M5UWM5_9CNID
MDISTNGNSEENVLEWGETVNCPKESHEFVYTCTLQQEKCVLRIPFTLPMKESTRELMYRIIASHNVPCYVHNDLYRALNSFVTQKEKEYTNTIHTKMLDALKQDGYREKQLHEWSKVLSDDVFEKRRSKSFTIDSAWSDIYHDLIHSPALESLLQLEHTYAVTMKDMVKQRDQALKDLTNTHVAEMEEAIANVGYLTTDEDINQMAARQLENSQMQEIYWSSAISELQEKQKREYKEWVMNVHERSTADISVNSNNDDVVTRTTRSPSMESYVTGTFDSIQLQETMMEESFTIHLGKTHFYIYHDVGKVFVDSQS